MNQRTGTKHKTVRSRLAELGPQLGAQLSAQLGVHPQAALPIDSPERIAIVLDAMGSDKSPAPEIAGAILDKVMTIPDG